MRILRYPWTGTLIETLHSRIFELYIAEKFPTQVIEYLGRDFPLSSENIESQSPYRQSTFTGSLTQNPIRFLDQLSDISNFIGIQLRQDGSVAHKELGIRHLFQSETFCRDIRAHHFGCRDSSTKKFLDEHEIPSTLIGCVSSLLCKLDTQSFPNLNHTEVLLIDVTDELKKCILESKVDNMSCISISTKVPEISGESQKTALVDLLILQMFSSKIVITSNLDLAIPAVALGKKTLLIQELTDNEERLNEYVTIVSTKEIFDGITWTKLDALLNLQPAKHVTAMASEVEEFIGKVWGDAPKLKSNLSVDAFKDQVLSEAINSQLIRIKNLEVIEEQMEGLLTSRSWKVTVPLRKFSDWSRKYSERLRSKSNREISDRN